ncbi:MAG: SURF1 family protein [Gammaproteobacteria bacterium]|nr:SURF1 family protein [Gammaproteobacteria bacterium]
MGSSLLFTGLILAFIALGNWQLDRAQQKAEIQQQFEQAPSFDRLPEAGSAPRYANVRLLGRFDSKRHVLIDNQVLKGRPGVHVLTPFLLEDGRWILVNRGWQPLPPDRSMLPSVPTGNALQTITGKLDEIYQPGRRVGDPDTLQPTDWPQLLTYPDLDDIAMALGEPLYPLTLLLDEAHPEGFAGRQWKPVNTGAAKHRARALQWYTFVVAALVIWVFLGFRRGAKK